MKVYIGYDSREDIAYQVCRYSIKSRRNEADIEPLKQDQLRERKIYWRDVDPDSSTEFTFTRFLVPYLNDYKGWAVFCDCDFLWVEDIERLFKLKKDQYAVMVVKHDYNPAPGIKMDGQRQLPYPRKNWSSMVLWNCAHPANRCMTPEMVNTKPGWFLHRFQWLQDADIGELSIEWNFLVNWYRESVHGKPRAIHYTEGGPWFPNYFHTEYGANWLEEKYSYEKSIQQPPEKHKYLSLPPKLNNVVDKIIAYRIDYKNEYYNATRDEIIQAVDEILEPNVVAVDSEFRYARKGAVYDPMLESFVQGSGGQITTWDMIENESTPVVIRGIAKRKQIYSCWENKRDFYYIDTGYFGNNKRKLYHRITKNHLQNIWKVISRPRDRLLATGWRPCKFRKGTSILICPPSAKVMKFFDLDLDEWMKNTVDTIKKYTDRPIVIRLKQSRDVRTNQDTLSMALSRDVHCLVTFNSIAATEALLLGKPAITLGPNAAQSLCSQNLNMIETPYTPTLDEVEEWAAHLAYSQFTEEEMRNGLAWEIINDECSNLSRSNP